MKFLLLCFPIIIVAGQNEFIQLGNNSDNKNNDDCPIIFPPLNLPIETSSLLSYSSSNCFTAAVKNDGCLLGVGYNGCAEISSSHPRSKIEDFTEFSIYKHLTPLSAVCCNKFALYLITKSDCNGT